MLRKTYKRRILLVALMAAMLFAVVFGALLTNRPAKAHVCYSILKEYYSDDTYTEVVGQQYWPCDGQPSSWGTPSLYVETSREPCGGINCEGLP